MPINGDNAADILFEDRPEYLHARVSGPRDSVSVSVDFWRRCIDECRRHGRNRLLVEESFPNRLDTMETFAVGAAVARMPTDRLRIAFLDNESDHDPSNEFGETVAVNRGAPIRVFRDRAAAEEWLGL